MSTLKELVVQSLDDDKALDIEAIDIAKQNIGQSAIADYIIIASGTSSAHVKGIADRLKDRLTARGIKGIKLEGATQGDWIVMDAGDIVVHLFKPEVREFYNIEKMWAMGATSSNTHDGFQTA